MRRTSVCLLFALQILCSFAHAAGPIDCPAFRTTTRFDGAVGVLRVESLMGRQTPIIDVSDAIDERRGVGDPNLRVINLGQIFPEGRLFLGFGRPNVFIGIPGVERHGLGYAKVDAKSLRRADTRLVPTRDKAQSGLLMVFRDYPAEATEAVLAAARRHEGTRRWTCVNANCRILSDAGFTIGGESLANYYFPIPLFRDIMRYGLQFAGQPVNFDVVKTTPGYLEDIGLSINQAVWTTLCRHAERSCAPLARKLAQNSVVMKVNDGLRNNLGLALFDDADGDDNVFAKPRWEAQPALAQIAPEDRLLYDLEVSEPSQFGALLRLLWGPHSLFEIPLPAGQVARHLPRRLEAFPDPNPSMVTRLKEHLLFSPPVISLIRSQMSTSYRRIEGLTHDLLINMLRANSDEYPNKYNFVVTGDRLIVMKLDIRNSYVDWVLSKHVLMSNYSQDVRFAGEIWKSPDGTIHINNNSGTYKPDFDPAAILALMQALFPGAPIQVHGIQSEPRAS